MEVQTLNKIGSFNEVTNNSIKNIIINTLYSELNISNLRYQLVDNYNNLEIIKKEPFYVTPHIMGVNCWVIFLEHERKRYQVIINKKDLKFFQNQININQIKIYSFYYNHQINSVNELYPLTVLDGRFVNNGQDNSLIYSIQDIYIMSGNKLLNRNLLDKIALIDQVIPNINKGLDNKFTIKVIGVYNIENIGDLIFNKIKNSKLKINGLIFLPEKSGKTYIYINDNEFIQLRLQTSNNLISKQYNNLSIPTIPLQMSNKLQLDYTLTNEFVLRKTDIADVFEIYNLINKDKIYLNLSKENRMGIAHIPDTKTSHYCKMMGNTQEIFINKCIYNNKFKKWMPIIN